MGFAASAPVVTSPPHAPTSICGTAVSYDGNGNTLSYDVDGARPQALRSFVYDLENRPVVITRGGVPAVMAYGPDGERVSKSFNGSITHYLGNDAEFTINSIFPVIRRAILTH